MTTTTTQINITAKDSTAGAFNSAQQNLTSLAGSAVKTAAGLAGIGLSIAGAIDAVRSISQATIQFQQFSNTLQVGTGSAKGAADALEFVRNESQRLGLDLASSAEQFAKLSAAARGTSLEGKATRDIFTSVAQASTAMGLSAEQTSGALLAIQQMISKGNVSAEELRGQLGERLPGAFQIAARAIGVTTQELDKMLKSGSVTAEQMLPALSAELDKTFGAQAEQAAQGLTAQMNRMNTAIFDLKIAIGESGLISWLSSGIELATKLTNAMTGVFGGGKKLSPIQEQITLIKELEDELTHMQGLNSILPFSDMIFSKKDQDLIKFRIESAKEDLEKLKAAVVQDSNPDNTVIAVATKQAEQLATKARKTVSESERFIASLKKEAQTVGLTSIEMKRLEAANLGVSRTADPLIDRIELVTKEMDEQKTAAATLATDLKKIESITESVKTKEEKLIDTTTELNRLMKSGLSIETYNRALKKAQDETRGLERATAQTTDEITQFWIQANRNIQTSLANGIFDFFTDGLDGMVRSVKSTVLRIISEFAALKILEFFGGSGGTGSAGGTISTLAGLASMFGGARNGGVTSGVFSNAGGAGTAFIGGPGTALGGSGMGVNATRGTGLGSGNLMAMGSMAGPYGMAAAAAVIALQALEKKVGDYKLSGGAKFALGAYETFSPMAYVVKGLGLQTPEALIGKFLFGRGPYKFRQQSLQGNLSNQGIDGTLTDVFKSKGGVFVGNKHKSFENDLPSEIYRDVDKTLKSIYKSTSEFAKNLGVDASQIDTYTKEIQIKSEKGKTITTEAVSDMLTSFADDVAKLAMPDVESFALTGESASKTFARLNNELDALKNGVENLGGSVAYAAQLINAMSIDARSAFIDQAGGIDRLSELTSAFFDGFLTDSEQLGVKTDQLNTALAKLGLSADLTKEQFKALVQSVDTSNEMRIGLLELVPAFLSVRNAQNQLIGVTNDLVDSELTLTSLRSELLSSYGKERNELESTIDKFKNISSTLRDFKNSLALGQLSPLTPQQKLEEARTQFNRTRALADKGDQGALADLPRVSQEFLQASQTYNASSAAYISDFNLVKSVLDKASTAALTQSEVSQKQLDELKSTVEYLTGIKDEARTTNEILKDLLAATLNSKGNAGISTKDIQNYLQANPNMTAKDIANAAIKYGVSKDQLVAAGIKSEAINKYTGGATVSDKDILDFVNSGATPMQIYQAAVANGVTSARLSKVTGISMTDINKFVKDNHLQSFAKGTDFIAKTGIVMAHRGEAIVPSSTTEEIKKLREELAKLRQEQNQQTGDMMKITDLSNQRNAKMISDALAQIENRRQWNDKSKVRLA